LPALGEAPSQYNATHIQQIIPAFIQHLSRSVAKKITTALKAYLRFLSVEGLCTPDLDKTVPTVAQWKLSSMPRYITSDEIERVIACCDINTH
jgi:site-specific recombinase XerD